MGSRLQREFTMASAEHNLTPCLLTPTCHHDFARKRFNSSKLDVELRFCTHCQVRQLAAQRMWQPPAPHYVSQCVPLPLPLAQRTLYLPEDIDPRDDSNLMLYC